ncbi:MAG: hypothetical protein EXR55_04185 [Dehalococcoidia bacterium]|nr:hypothetical protein [Dehalococcoidia bacterium]
MDDLSRLRLQYEHSRATCSLCRRMGTVGEDLKLYLTEAIPPQVFFRCVDPLACRRRAGSAGTSILNSPETDKRLC